MDDPEEPRVKVMPQVQGPVETYEGQTAIVRLYSWGTARSPAYSLNVVPIINGRRTCGRTFTAGSVEGLRLAAPGYVTEFDSMREDIEHCLSLADRQGRFPFIVDDEARS